MSAAQERVTANLEYLTADFEYVKITLEVVWIRDLDLGSISVTNDAVGVCRRVWHDYPGRRVIYQDSEGAWDELKHDGGKFTGFTPARDMVPA
jgi:hypothetical protein